MLKAIHKKTEKIVSAFKVENDSSWIGTEREKWIAPRPEIYNWKFLNEQKINEVKVSFVKSHKRKYEEGEVVPVVAHFRIECEKAIPHPESESEEHKLAKEAIYDEIINNNIFIEGKPIRDIFKIKDVDFEIKLSKSKKSKIADILVTFKEEDVRLGKGIVFEIQFSHQNVEITDERTYDRIVEGYSVVWLYEKDFEEYKLKKKEVLVVPFSSAIKEYQKKIFNKWEEKVIKYGRSIDEKTSNFLLHFGKYEKSVKEKYESLLDFEEEIRDKIQQDASGIKAEKAQEIINLFNEQIEKVKETIKVEEIVKNQIQNIDYYRLSKEIVGERIQELKTYIDSILKEELNLNIKEKVERVLTESLIKETIPKIESQYKEKIKGWVFCKCHKCEGKFPVRSMEFKDGWAYCSNCFVPKEDKNENKICKGQQSLQKR